MEEVVINITEIVEAVTINITEPVADVVTITISEAIQGEQGISAYAVAVTNGYGGSEVQWLASLKGADGTPGPASTVAGPPGDKGNPFVYTDFTPQQLEDLKGDPFTYTDFTPEQIEALKVKGDQGDAFEYSDFTPEQIAALKGEKGDAFVYEDFTPEELVLLKGDKGDPGTTDFTELSNKPTELADINSTEGNKLSGIETGANNYTHPTNHAPSIITQDTDNRFVSDTEKSTWNAKQPAGSYLIAADISNKTDIGLAIALAIAL